MDTPAKLAEDRFDISITFDGTWLHQGVPIARLPLVRLFATALTRDAAGDYWLMTPHERGRIAVADAPFVAVGWRMAGEGDAATLYLTDTLGRETAVDAVHPLTLRLPRGTGGPFVPYHQLGDGIEARLATSVYYDLVDYALTQGRGEASGRLCLMSAGVLHPVGLTGGGA